MNKLGIYILSTFTMLVYVMSVVGVGVHTCQHSGKQRVVLLVHKTCMCGHEHEKTATCAHEEESCCSAENHDCNTDDSNTDESCCDIAYKVLQVDQETHAAKSLLKNFTEYFTSLFVPVTALGLPHAPAITAFNHSPPPFVLNTVPDIYRLSQLRL